MKIRKEDERMMKKRIKTGGALILAAVLAISAFAINSTLAANGVENKACSLTVDVSKVKYKEVKTEELTVNLYRVADIDVTGEYDVEDAYDSVLDLSDIGPDLAANEWETKAIKLQEFIDGLNNDDNSENDIIATNSKSAVSKLEFNNLEKGMYLVYAEQLLTDYYQYDFLPYLVSLPDNRFYQTNDDEWLYDIQVSLKPLKTDRVGDLVIEKTLDVFNATLGEASFVFQVEAEKTDVDMGTPSKVYSNVVSLSFDSVGTKQVVIEDIPAGAVVTVTEVYSGASYKLISSSIEATAEEGKLVIIADGEEGVTKINFLNEYNEEDRPLNGGNGLVNEFTYSTESGWSHQAKPDSISAPLE